MKYKPDMLKKLLAILAVCSFSLILFSPAVTARTLEEIQRDIEEANRNRAALEQQEGSALEQLNVVDKRLSEIQRDISVLEDQLDILQTEKDAAELELIRLEAELAAAENRMNEQGSVIDTRLSGIYKQGDTGYIEVILGSSSFDDFISRLNYLKIILKSDTRVMQEYKATRDVVAENRELADTKKQDIIARTNSIHAIKMPLDTRKAEESIDRSEKERLLSEIHGSQALEEERLAAAYAEQQEILNRSRGGGGGPSVGLIWPIENHYINCVWGYHDCNVHVNRPHTGIDLPEVYEGQTEIWAAAAGEVVWAGWGSGGDAAYGIFVQINHPDGKSTVYGHMYGTLVSVGDYVSQGQPVGYAGTTGHSTGPHLHFEVYDPNNQDQIYGTVNPLEYLP